MGGFGGFGLAALANYFMRKENERIQEMLDRNRRRLAQKGRRLAALESTLEARMDEAEADLGRAILLAFAVKGLLVHKQILTTRDISEVASELDLKDGTADGRLDPAAVRPSDRSVPKPPKTPEEFLRRLEQEP
jgi:hypothetical protein